jgi:hypothetical protein
MSPYLTKAIHQRAYADAHAKYVESVRLGIEKDRRERFFPSTSRDAADGNRRHVSQLGGVALPKEQR